MTHQLSNQIRPKCPVMKYRCWSLPEPNCVCVWVYMCMMFNSGGSRPQEMYRDFILLEHVILRYHPRNYQNNSNFYFNPF